MSKIFEALQQSNPEMNSCVRLPDAPIPGSALLASVTGEYTDLDQVATFRIPAVSSGRLIVATEPHSLASTKIRAMVARLRHIQQVRGIKKILITSAACGDGKTTFSANLAIALAMHGDKTLLINGDLHQPALDRLLQVDGQNGFSDWNGERPIVDLLRRALNLPLWFLPAGSGEDSLMKVQSATTPELLRRMGNLFSWIIIDSPPLLPLADSSVWNTMVDGVLLLVRQGATPKKVLLKALESFDKSKLLGVIMNDAVSTEEKYLRYYYAGTKSASKRSTPHINGS